MNPEHEQNRLVDYITAIAVVAVCGFWFAMGWLTRGVWNG